MGVLKRVPGKFNDPVDYLVNENTMLTNAVTIVADPARLVDNSGDVSGVVRKRIAAYFPVVKR
ncbi:MAG: hypothetical protein PHR28_13930 [candidate division Zixibacteria bacterium]|jgi:hypothetical protein|nr:hypothetical protein [candidate division Zixibacteria bacterium]